MAIRDDFGLDFSKMRVLLVEDNQFALNLARSALAELGFETVIDARDGGEAIRAMENFPHFQLIISDWNMPNVTGLDLLKMARERWAGVPFVMLTSNDSKAHVDEARKSGVFAYIVKPFSLAGMRKQIVLAIRKRLAQGGEFADDADQVYLAALSNIEAVGGFSDIGAKAALKPETERFEQAIETLVLSPTDRSKHLARLDEVTQDLVRSVAADVHLRNLVSGIAGQLRIFVDSINAPTSMELEIIKLHVETIRALVTDAERKVTSGDAKHLLAALALATSKAAQAA